MDRLVRESMNQRAGYGMDDACAEAADKLRRKLGRDDVCVHFLIGGTSANAIAMSAFMRPHEAVICPTTAHVNQHETGAIEAAGHKLLCVAADDGKLVPHMIEDVYAAHTDEHMVRPRVVYISNATELGTLYTLAELRGLRLVCDRLGLILYMDGARLGSAMAASDVGFADLCGLLDAFYVGGTKNGAPLGEAMVIVNDALKPDFRYIEKRHAGMLAKGFILGHIFSVLFDNDLYVTLAARANKCADILRGALTRHNIPLTHETVTNMVFALVPTSGVTAWLDAVGCQVSGRSINADETILRFVTSWATTIDQLDQFERAVAALAHST